MPLAGTVPGLPAPGCSWSFGSPPQALDYRDLPGNSTDFPATDLTGQRLSRPTGRWVQNIVAPPLVRCALSGHDDGCPGAADCPRRGGTPAGVDVRFPPAQVRCLGLNAHMTLDFDTCYRAVLARDARFDGRFFTGVTSTGIYCRPICPARTPARRNMRFFPHPGAAEAAGFRACRRCRPETSPGSPDWNVRADLAARAVRLIADGYVDEHGVTGLADRLAVTERHLRRLLLAELGAGPLALARTTRLQTARRLLAETSMPVTDIAFASGFASVRQFNASFQESYGQPPSALRRRGAEVTGPATGPAAGHAAGHGVGQPAGTWLTLRLACRQPLGSGTLLDFLALRAVPGIEQVRGNSYRRTVHTPGGPGVIELRLPA